VTFADEIFADVESISLISFQYFWCLKCLATDGLTQ